MATYEPAYDSETLNCAPSYTLQGGNNGGGGTATLEESLIADELAQGWDVNVPDYEGLQSEWTVAPLLGRVSLDSVKAAEHFWPDGLTRGARTEVTFNGYSGGSEAADWAAALAPRYAPELNIVGIVGGGNFPDFDYTLSQLDGTAWYGIEPGVFESYSRAFRDFNLQKLLNPAGQAIAAAGRPGRVRLRRRDDQPAGRQRVGVHVLPHLGGARRRPAGQADAGQPEPALRPLPEGARAPLQLGR